MLPAAADREQHGLSKITGHACASGAVLKRHPNRQTDRALVEKIDFNSGYTRHDIIAQPLVAIEDGELPAGPSAIGRDLNVSIAFAGRTAGRNVPNGGRANDASVS